MNVVLGYVVHGCPYQWTEPPVRTFESGCDQHTISKDPIATEQARARTCTNRYKP